MGGWMCDWNGCDVDVDVNSKEKINPFYLIWEEMD